MTSGRRCRVRPAALALVLIPTAVAAAAAPPRSPLVRLTLVEPTAEVAGKSARWQRTVEGAGLALGETLRLGPDGRSVLTEEREIVAVPYHLWNHRGDGAMAVWLPRKVALDFAVP